MKNRTQECLHLFTGSVSELHTVGNEEISVARELIDKCEELKRGIGTLSSVHEKMYLHILLSEGDGW